MHAPLSHLPRPPSAPTRSSVQHIVGTLTLSIGVLVLTGWVLGIQTLSSLGLNTPPMVANAALAFILSGTALLFINSARSRLRFLAHASTIVIGALAIANLVELATDWNLGIDELIALDSHHLPPLSPGRMAPNTAAGFLLTSIGLWLMSPSGTRVQRWPWIIDGLGLSLTLLGAAALLGYLTGFTDFYDWWQFKAMPLPVALLFTLIGVAMIGFSLAKSGVHWRLGYWLSAGFGLGLTLIIATAIYARSTSDQIAEANARVRHSLTIEAKLRQLETAIDAKTINLQGYLLTHNATLREQTLQSLATIQTVLTELRTLTTSDTQLQAQLDRTAQLISERSEFINQLITARQSGDSTALADANSLASATILSGKTRSQLDEIIAHITGLLVTQQASAERLSAYAAAILPIELLMYMMLIAIALLRMNAEASANSRYLETLRRSEELKTSILNSMPSEIALLSPTGGIVAVNEPWLRFARERGAPAERLIGVGANYLDVCRHAVTQNSPYAAEALAGIQAVLTGTRTEFQLEYPSSSSTQTFWYLLHATPIRGAAGGGLVAHFDITARKQTEDALRESELQMRLALSGGDLGIWDWNAVTDNLTVNERWLTMLGLDPQGPRPTLSFWRSLVHPDDLHRLDEITHNIIIPKSGRGFESEVRARHQNGNYLWILDKGTVVERSADGQPLRVIGTHMDITKRKAAEMKIQQLNAELEQRVFLRTKELQAANHALEDFKAALDEHCIVSITDKYGTITYANDQFCSISNYTRAELIGQNHRIINSKFHPNEFFTGMWETILSGRVWHGEICNQAKGGRMYWVNSTLVPFVGEDGKPFQFISIRNDITALKTAEANILKLNADLTKRAETLEAVNKELEAFSYSVSHDLRGPLRSIDGYSRMAIEDYSALLDDNGRRVLNVIRAEAQRMSRLIDDLLAFSRISRQQAEHVTIDMQAMAQAVYTELISSEPARTVEFKLQALPVAQGAPEMIRQVWVNLLSNALKFTRNRPVAVIEVSATSAANGSWVYQVKDNGAGFDMRYVGKLFGVFQRLHNQPDFEGTGVGLALVQRILQRHGGTIWAEGEVDHGACFSFTLPESASTTPSKSRVTSVASAF